jgi:hypothetical protein
MYGIAASTVTSHSTPKLVEQINTALADLDTDSLTTADIDMDGTVSDTLAFNDGKAATVTGLTATVNFANITAPSGAIDTDYVQFKLLTMDNDSEESVDWAYINAIVDDNTTNTEDTAVELYVQVGGVATKALNVDASGVDCGSLKVLATAGDLGDGNLDNVGAISCDSIGADGTAVAINTGTGEVTLDGKYAVVGGDATTGLMIQKGDGAAVTNGATVTFPTVFGGVPTVILGADESTTTVPYPSSVTASNFVVNGEAAKVQNWIAVGTRP